MVLGYRLYLYTSRLSIFAASIVFITIISILGLVQAQHYSDIINFSLDENKTLVYKCPYSDYGISITIPKDMKFPTPAAAKEYRDLECSQKELQTDSDLSIQKLAMALIISEDEFDEIIKETEDKTGHELPEETKDALHSAAEKYRIEHGLVSPQDENTNSEENDDVEDNDNDDN
jgi:hypothetical protein